MVIKVKSLENYEQNQLSSKNIDWKIHFSINSAHCASAIKMGAKFKGGWRVLHNLIWEKPNMYYKCNRNRNIRKHMKIGGVEISYNRKVRKKDTI